MKRFSVAPGLIFSVFLLLPFSVQARTWTIYSFGDTQCEPPPTGVETPFDFEEMLRSNNTFPNIVEDKAPDGVLLDVQIQFTMNNQPLRAIYFPDPSYCQAFAAMQQLSGAPSSSDLK